MENHVESHWKTTEIKSNNYFPPPKKKVIDHPPICTLSNAGVPDSPPETQHLKSSLMIGTQRPSGPSRLPTERTWITHKGLTSCGNLVALKEHKVKKKTHIFGCHEKNKFTNQISTAVKRLLTSHSQES